MADWYEEHRESQRAKMRTRYKSTFKFASPELLAHLRANLPHARGEFQRGEVCPECTRMEAKPAVCLMPECGRMGFRTLDLHLRSVHKISVAAYNAQIGFNRRTSQTSPEYRVSARESERLKKYAFTSGTAKAASAKATNLGRRHRLRPEAIATRRIAQRGKFRTRDEVKNWPIAELRLQGMEYGEIAKKLGHSERMVTGRCRAMGFPLGHPVRFLRGESFGARQLRDWMQDHDHDATELGKAAELAPHRIQRSLRRGGALPLAIANAILPVLRSPSQTAFGRGRRPKLSKSETGKLRAKYPAVKSAIRAVLDEISETESPKSVDVAEALCRLAHRRTDARMLLFWGVEFLDWRAANALPDMMKQTLSPPHVTAREFLAKQFGVAIDAVPKMRDDSPSQHAISERERRCILEVWDTFGTRQCMFTRELLAELRAGKSEAAALSEHSLADLARLATGTREKPTIRIGATVLKGYRRDQFKWRKTSDVAREMRIALPTIKKLIAEGKITAPPLTQRTGIRGAGCLRVWLRPDIDAAKVAARSTIRLAMKRTVTRQPVL